MKLIQPPLIKPSPLFAMEKTCSTLSDSTMEDVPLQTKDLIAIGSLTTTRKTLYHQITPPWEPSPETAIQPSVNDSFFGGSPVIGVFSQPRISSETETTEYIIAASYVKWVECAGARVLPIPWDATAQMVQDVFPQINGLLLIGGNSILSEAARTMWQLAKTANENGEFFPIWGTCLGYEYLLMLASGKDEFVMEGGYQSHNVCWPVELVPEEPSELYADRKIQSIVTTQPVTMNNHEFGLSPEQFRACPALNQLFRMTSINVDFQGKPFVSTIEPRDPARYPYYGVQYHPEKTAFEYGTEPGTNTPFENINHSADAIYFSFHLASFFFFFSRQNLQRGQHIYHQMDRFPLVYSYPVYSGLKFQQYYVIPAVGGGGQENGKFGKFVGKDFSWKLDDYLADHVGIYKTEYTDE